MRQSPKKMCLTRIGPWLQLDLGRKYLIRPKKINAIYGDGTQITIFNFRECIIV